MTLMSKMTAALLGMLLLLFSGAYLITFYNARAFFIEQLNSNALDTATSLSLSLSQSMASQDRKTIASMVKVVFGHDDFSMIEVRDQAGGLVVSQQEQSGSESAPAWFVDLIEWPSSMQSAVIMSEGKRIGDVLVTSDSRFACHALWRNALHLLCWYAVFAVLFLLMIFVFLRHLLAPLSRLINQAERISQGELAVEPRIPDTAEFRKLTLLMNHIVNVMLRREKGL